ncbi:unnamed protein product [Dibothriocephalus latus]|uniref:Uncharacterized protein n=1 Tax=Dibothriocephalus latus TaxID=60516 RepID=A0A3P6V437_DIBLA|nr:unnamed protein product [Dibothriocephalus latus]
MNGGMTVACRGHQWRANSEKLLPALKQSATAEVGTVMLETRFCRPEPLLLVTRNAVGRDEDRKQAADGNTRQAAGHPGNRADVLVELTVKYYLLCCSAFSSEHVTGGNNRR